MAIGKRKVLKKEHRDRLIDVLSEVHPRFGESSNAPGFASGPSTVKGELDGKPFTATFGEKDVFLVVLPKPVAKTVGLSPTNRPGAICVWDPVTGEIYCSDQE
jgi:hypothetical protein